MDGRIPHDQSPIQIRRQYYDSTQGLLHCHTSQPTSSCQGPQNPRDNVPVLLLHMSASSSKSCLPLMRRLSGLGFCCFAPDMPGFGESFDLENAPTGIDWYSQLYVDVFAKLPAFQRGCHIIGHHSGAVIGTDLAAYHGSFVQSLTLVGPAIMSAAERRQWAAKTLVPFNQPLEDGSHLSKTWDYLIEMGIPAANLALLQREVLDHLRAWQGRLQIYARVWAYDCAAALKSVSEECRIAALCASDDVLWPYFENVGLVRAGIARKEIRGANFALDLGTEDILNEFLALIEE